VVGPTTHHLRHPSCLQLRRTCRENSVDTAMLMNFLRFCVFVVPGVARNSKPNPFPLLRSRTGSQSLLTLYVRGSCCTVQSVMTFSTRIRRQLKGTQRGRQHTVSERSADTAHLQGTQMGRQHTVRERSVDTTHLQGTQMGRQHTVRERSVDTAHLQGTPTHRQGTFSGHRTPSRNANTPSGNVQWTPHTFKERKRDDNTSSGNVHWTSRVPVTPLKHNLISFIDAKSWRCGFRSASATSEL
jgi:hypothetical protein